MHPLILRRLIFRKRQQWVARKSALYSEQPARHEIEARQVARFNARWSECLSMPFYRRWAAEHDLPAGIERPTDLLSWPLLTKDVLVERAEEVFADGDRLAYSTGGSTGRPARYPRGKADIGPLYGNMYACRAWWGVRPFDPQIALWGHAHLFGTGVGGHLRVAQRRAADHLLNIRRLDAYDLSASTLEAHAHRIATSDPAFIYGYTSAVFKVARVLHESFVGYEPRGLRAVSVTAETVTDADLDTIAGAFKTAVTIEYGTAETGVIAHSRGTTRHIQVLWDAYIALSDEAGNLVLSTLDRRRFPLINYAVGDLVEPLDEDGGNCLSLRAIVGRQKDVLTLRSRAGAAVEVSAILPVHILKTYPGITSVQFSRVPPTAARIHLEVDRTTDVAAVAAYFREQFGRDYPDVDTSECLTFELVTSADLTLAGKHRLFRE